MQELKNLLYVQPGEIHGLLEELSAEESAAQGNFDVRFFQLRFQGGLARVDSFISKLCDHVPSFCLTRSKLTDIPANKVRQLYLEAKRKFAQPKDGKTGEPGELVTFFLMEGVLCAPKIFSKMSLKTNSQMHVHGSDGIHLGHDDKHVTLYFGESKLYSVATAAITEALSSISDFVYPSGPGKQSQQEFEINVLADNIDLPDGTLKELVLNSLNPYNSDQDKLRYTYVCFIGFDMDELAAKCEPAKFAKAYDKKAKDCLRNIFKKVASDPKLSSLSLVFFFIPFASVEKFRNSFLKELEA